MITLKEAKALLDKSENPLIFFDDDPDGLCSYLLLKKYLKRGNGLIVKNSPTLDETYVVKVRQYTPDLVVVLDKPMMSQEFIDKIHVPILWIDHHPINDVKGVNYFNPRFKDEKDNRPTTYWCHQMLKGKKWIALLGILFDYSLADVSVLRKSYSNLFDGKILKKPDDVYDTSFGHLIRIVSFGLKGEIKETYKFIELMEKVEEPEEILEQTTPIGKKIYQKFSKVDKVYQELLKEALKQKDEDFLVYTYVNDALSLTADLANEVKYRVQSKITLIARIDRDEVKGSLRNKDTGKDLPSHLKKALEGLHGYGGGHPHACGFCVKKDDFPVFVERLKKSLL